MSPRRRIILTVLSVSIGTALSVWLFKMKNSGKPLSDNDWLWLSTNFGFSLLIVLGIGIYLLKRKDKNDGF